ncbi:MAG: hypothetical protein RID22_14910 [Roseibium aggregatum]|jgi:hypothetical protein|uniref:hypothetical protein n=1 Tax=uncultured Roseibium sp. TaxID=1936171 RepID=UPI0026204810|nr:hypothetical protein [uncultured Roseibium sp.]
MAEHLHNLAPHYLPGFLPSEEGSDPLMIAVGIFLVAGVVLIGVLYLHLHHLPEKIAHKHGRIQLELIAVLSLLAMFTHIQIFWVAALLLAFIPIPDFKSPIESIAGSLKRLSQKNNTAKIPSFDTQSKDDTESNIAIRAGQDRTEKKPG